VNERARLMAIGERLCDEAESKGVTGRRLLWRLHRARIMRDLSGFLEKDEELRREFGVVPEAVELAFGVADAEQPPLVVQIDGRAIAFRGRIDRVDRAPDGSRLVVIDYKTGSQYGAKELRDDPVRRGQALQLPIYGLAAQRQYGDVETEAFYWYASEKENYDRAGYPLTKRELDAFRGALGAIAGGIGAGAFPARPGKGTDEGFTNCRFCAFDAACARDRSRAWERVRGAPELATYVELAEPDS
jgi:hypothetical protein